MQDGYLKSENTYWQIVGYRKNSKIMIVLLRLLSTQSHVYFFPLYRGRIPKKPATTNIVTKGKTMNIATFSK